MYFINVVLPFGRNKDNKATRLFTTYTTPNSSLETRTKTIRPRRSSEAIYLHFKAKTRTKTFPVANKHIYRVARKQ